MPLSDEMREALQEGETIDITTTGRRTGLQRRQELSFVNVDGKIYLSGRPEKKDWHANLLANPDFIFHLKLSVQADLKARAQNVGDPEERKRLLRRISGKNRTEEEMQPFYEGSPLLEVTFPED
jgi:deazaflavin-dependent oxidoreductase (nitroreductase family)